MKKIKLLFMILYVSIWTLSWWFSGIFATKPSKDDNVSDLLWAVVAMLTFIQCMFGFLYLKDNWGKD